jgi:hypothetical protein
VYNNHVFALNITWHIMYCCLLLPWLLYVPLAMFQGASETVCKRASMMGDMHLRSIRQKLWLKQRTEEAVKKLQVCFLLYQPFLPPVVDQEICFLVRNYHFLFLYIKLYM